MVLGHCGPSRCNMGAPRRGPGQRPRSPPPAVRTDPLALPPHSCLSGAWWKWCCCQALTSWVLRPRGWRSWNQIGLFDTNQSAMEQIFTLCAQACPHPPLHCRSGRQGLRDATGWRGPRSARDLCSRLATTTWASTTAGSSAPPTPTASSPRTGMATTTTPQVCQYRTPRSFPI